MEKESQVMRPPLPILNTVMVESGEVVRERYVLLPANIYLAHNLSFKFRNPRHSNVVLV